MYQSSVGNVTGLSLIVPGWKRRRPFTDQAIHVWLSHVGTEIPFNGAETGSSGGVGGSDQNTGRMSNRAEACTANTVDEVTEKGCLLYQQHDICYKILHSCVCFS